MAADTLAHESMGTVEYCFDGLRAPFLLALGDVFLGEAQVVEDRGRIGPLPEEVVVFEEVIMAQLR